MDAETIDRLLQEDVLPLEKACELYLNVEVDTATRYIRAGRLEGYKSGVGWITSRQACARYLATLNAGRGAVSALTADDAAADREAAQYAALKEQRGRNLRRGRQGAGA